MVGQSSGPRGAQADRRPVGSDQAGPGRNVEEDAGTVQIQGRQRKGSAETGAGISRENSDVERRSRRQGTGDSEPGTGGTSEADHPANANGLGQPGSRRRAVG